MICVTSESNYPMELDIWLPNENLAFEYQGEQHYIDVRRNEGLGPDIRTTRTPITRPRKARGVSKGRNSVLIEIPYTWDKTIEYVRTILDEEQ